MLLLWDRNDCSGAEAKIRNREVTVKGMEDNGDKIGDTRTGELGQRVSQKSWLFVVV